MTRHDTEIEQLYLDNLDMIQNLARKIAEMFHCGYLQEDLVSAGTVVFLERHPEYDETSGTALSTYLYPHIKGAMLREIERNSGAMTIPKREFYKHYKGHHISALRSVSLYEPIDDEGNYLAEYIPSPEPPPEQQIYTQICMEYMCQAFGTLSFKERQILGGYFGVFGHEKRTLADIGEEFCLKENSARKAKDRALEKLRRVCMSGDFGIWVSICATIKNTRQEWADHACDMWYEPQPCYWIDILSGQINQLIKSLQDKDVSKESTGKIIRNLAIEAVAEQFLYKRPALTADILNRLLKSGLDWLTAIEMIATASLEEAYYICKYASYFNSKRYARKLRHLGSGQSAGHDSEQGAFTPCFPAKER